MVRHGSYSVLAVVLDEAMLVFITEVLIHILVVHVAIAHDHCRLCGINHFEIATFMRPWLPFLLVVPGVNR